MIKKTTPIALFLLFCCVFVSAGEKQLQRDQPVALIIPETPSTQELLALDDLTAYLQQSLKSVVRRYPNAVEISVLDEQVALLLPPEDVEAWVRALKELIDDPERMQHLSIAAKARASQYGWKARASRTLEGLEDD